MLYKPESTVIGFKVADKGLSVLGPTGVKRSPILRLHNVAGQKAGDLGGFKSKEVLQQGQFMRVDKCQVIKRRRLPYKCYQVSMWPSLTVFAHITLKTLEIH